MRKTTLAGIAYFFSIVIAYAVTFGIRASGLGLPGLGFLTHLMAGFFIAPLVLLPLSKLNRHLLAWRKARGRDVEEEEKYENVEAGVISLRPIAKKDFS